MKPWQILFFFIGVCLLLGGIALVFPQEGLKLSEDMTLKFPSTEDIFHSDSIYYADISQIVENSGSLQTQMEEEIVDSLNLASYGEQSVPVDTIRADPDSLKRITQLIEFPTDGRKKYYDLFERLHRLGQSGDLIRILHYGDSQIETDRISGLIRNRLQKRFGGSGPGLVPPVPLYKGKMSVSQDFSSHWGRYTGFGKIDSTRGHSSYGALISYAAFDTTISDSTDLPWIDLKPSPIAYSTARRYNQISLYLSKKNEELMRMEVLQEDSVIDFIETSERLNYNKLSWNLNETPSSFKLKFYGKGSPELYGVSLDNQWGVALDNIPLRGSAGLVFSKNDTIQLRQMYEDMNVGMIILQFGGNVVPYMSNANVYKKIFRRELEIVKSLAPRAAVLVIGPSDMSTREKGKFVTHPNLEKIRDAMREVSLESGIAFWDMYEAMGGKNSMPSWVFAKPSLAINDFVHFNVRGARLMGEMLYNALIYEYNQWEVRPEQSLLSERPASL